LHLGCARKGRVPSYAPPTVTRLAKPSPHLRKRSPPPAPQLLIQARIRGRRTVPQPIKCSGFAVLINLGVPITLDRKTPRAAARRGPQRIPIRKAGRLPYLNKRRHGLPASCSRRPRPPLHNGEAKRANNSGDDLAQGPGHLDARVTNITSGYPPVSPDEVRDVPPTVDECSVWRAAYS